MEFDAPIAIIIEPLADLAEALGDVLTEHGFHVLTAATHIGAAALADGHCPLLIACVPAPGDRLDLAYLAECRQACGDIATVLLLSDPAEACEGAPLSAVPLVKPFERAELLLAVDAALLDALGAGKSSAINGAIPARES
jgi:DNA-binding response OmpR family regulator